MPRYANNGGDSNVYSYETGSDFIEVTFNDRGVYTYTNVSAGANAVTAMKQLAVGGRGLQSFINRNKPRYASRR